jgi:hypothetical protein
LAADKTKLASKHTDKTLGDGCLKIVCKPNKKQKALIDPFIVIINDCKISIFKSL